MTIYDNAKEPDGGEAAGRYVEEPIIGNGATDPGPRARRPVRLPKAVPVPVWPRDDRGASRPDRSPGPVRGRARARPRPPPRIAACCGAAPRARTASSTWPRSATGGYAFRPRPNGGPDP